MDQFNIYMIGVGGQGIGLLSEILIRAADHAGHRVKGVDTHGLAQRGGTVVSHLRMGSSVYSPIIPSGRADLVVALERNEALRGVKRAAKKGGVLVYYDTVWQPLDVRLGKVEPLEKDEIRDLCNGKNLGLYRVYDPDLPEPAMQNMAVLSLISKINLIPGVLHRHYRLAMEDLLEGGMLVKNMELFDLKTGGV